MLRFAASAWRRVGTASLRGQFSASAAPIVEAASKPRLSPYFLFVPSSVCGFLAYWQYERKQWKEELLDLRQRMLRGPAVDLYSLDAPGQYQKVSASGTFRHDCSLYVGPRPRSINGAPQLGYFIVTPLVTEDRKSAVMVNRGWVPASWQKNPEKAAQSTCGRVEVTGVVQPDETPSTFMPHNVPQEGRFHSIDREAMASSLGLPPSTVLLQVVCSDPDASPPQEASGHSMGGGARAPATATRPEPLKFPLQKHADELLRFAVMPKDHVGYAVTWGLLAVSLAVFARHVIVARPGRINPFVNNRAAWEGRRGDK